MTKDELFNAFEQLFPNWAIYATSYRKIGSKALAITFNFYATDMESDKETSRVFLYNSLNNWQFGTKLWRKRPERIAKKVQKEIESKEEPYYVYNDPLSLSEKYKARLEAMKEKENE